MTVSTSCSSFLIVLLAITASGCITSSSAVRQTAQMPLHAHDEDKMRSEVLRHVKVGMTISEAKWTMESHGFQCQFDQESKIQFDRGNGVGNASEKMTLLADPQRLVVGTAT